MLAAAFLANIIFVITARSTLVVFAALLVVLALQRFRWKGILGALMVGVILAAASWSSSPYLRARILTVFEEVQQYRTEDAETSSGIRLEFWRKSLKFVAASPVLGHGTGSIKGLFQSAATGRGGSSSLVTDQPHNQILIVAIQLGLVGAGLLLAMWIAHLWLFRGGGLVAWIGFGLVIQNVVSCLFNSYLFETTMGWLYVFGVGVLGGMLVDRKKARQSWGGPDTLVSGVARAADRS
jgi:O-antigen ligase